MIGLVLTLICGLFFLIGIIIYNKSKDKDKLILMSMSCAFIIILGLIIFDLMPELREINKWWIYSFILVGLLLLILIDLFIPQHTHEHHEILDNKKEHKRHLEHISLITIIALILHNIIEGVSIYSLTSNDLKSGLLMGIGTCLHNLPFGFSLATLENKKRLRYLLILLILSNFLGGIIGFIFGTLSRNIMGIVIAITMGMLIHLSFLELFKEVIRNIKKKETIYGIIIGIGLLIIINII